MSALVGYASSDEEQDDVLTERPAKKPRLQDSEAIESANEVIGAHTLIEPQDVEQPADAPYAPVEQSEENDGPPLEPIAGPTAPGPSAPLPDDPADTTPTDPPLSPHTAERLRLRGLTMPPIPNFDIPDAPSPPLPNSEAAAVLAATTKKFEHFLGLKKQGVHFNERLQNSAALRNPSLLPKLMEFAGIGLEDSYRSTIPEDVGGVPVRWPEECYVESLVRENERRERKTVSERDKVEFVAASKGKSGGESAEGTPSGGGGAGRKSKFDQR